MFATLDINMIAKKNINYKLNIMRSLDNSRNIIDTFPKFV